MSEQKEKKFTFIMGIRDDNAPNHWREVSKNYKFAQHKTVLVLPGSAAHSSKAANGMCKIVEEMLPEKIRKSVDICSLYFPENTKHREGSVVRALTLLDEYILPLVSKVNKKGYLEKISAEEAAKNLRNLTVFTHCYGSYMAEAIDIQLSKDLISLGYSEKEQKNIQKQLLVIHHNSISDLLGVVKMNSTNLYRITQADERRKLCMFNSDSFQYMAQTEDISADKVLYAKIGENERALLIKQITEEGEYEHNGAYWHDDAKSEGGEKEQQIMRLIFAEAVGSDYPLDNIEKLIRQAVKSHPDMKPLLTETLVSGKEFSDSYLTYRNKLFDKNLVLREKQMTNELKEKEIKTLPPEVLLYRDADDKMLLDYAIENNNVPQAKILWNAVRKMLPKNEGLFELEYAKLSRNYKQAYENHQMYLQLLLNVGYPEMFTVLAKGADSLPRLDYTVADDKTLLGAAKIYAGLPANTGQLDTLYYYKSLVYMYARVEKMPQTDETIGVMKQLDSKIFTKANAKNQAVKYKINSYALQFGAEELIQKTSQNWDEKPLFYKSGEELNK